jgi:hypothetical protein
MTMKYFTPQRFIRFQHVDEEQAFYAAHAEWEQAIEHYRRELAEIRSRLPAALARFAESVSLHDAQLIAIWRTRGRLMLLVRPEPPGDDCFVRLAYTLAGEPNINSSVLPPEYRSERAIWLYDEVTVERTGGVGAAPEDVFVHSILLSNGCEITIRFRRFEVSRPEAVFPARQELPVQAAGSVSRSA